jgi:dTDP-4-dehydrorhamnose reductase
MLKLAQTNDKITVVNDQIGSPTSTVDLANAIISLIESGLYGIYHATCEGQCSWYEFAIKIFELKQIDVKVVPVTTEQFIRPAKRLLGVYSKMQL